MKHKMLDQALKSIELSLWNEIIRPTRELCRKHGVPVLKLSQSDFMKKTSGIICSRMHNFLKDFNNLTLKLARDFITSEVNGRLEQELDKRMPKFKVMKMENRRLTALTNLLKAKINELEQKIERETERDTAEVEEG